MHNPLKSSLLTCLAMVVASALAQASTLTWDANGTSPANPADGSGTWDTTLSRWSNGTSDAVWNNANNDIAVFGNNNGAAGTVTVGTVTAGGVTFNAPGSGNYILSSGTLTLAGATPTITTNASATIGSVIVGSAGLVKAGTGTLTLAGANTYTGGTVINQGVLSFSAANNFATGQSVTVNGGTLQFAGSAFANLNRPLVLGTNGVTLEAAGTVVAASTIMGSSVSYLGTGARTVTLTGSTVAAGSITAVIGDNGGATSLIKNGSGVWNVQGANTYTGSTAINGGSLVLGVGDNRLSTSTALSIAASGTLNLNGSNQTVASLNDGAGGGGTVFNNAAATTKALTVGEGSFSGTIRDGSAGRLTSLAKNTSGTLRLSGTNNTYSAGTTISAGTLLINNVAGTGLGTGAVGVTNATLGGNGQSLLTGANSITVGANGVISPGDSAVSGGIGTLTLNGGSTTGSILDMQAGSSFSFNLGAGNANDTLAFYNYAGASDFLRDAGGIALNFTGAQAGNYDLFTFYSNAGTTLTSAGFVEATSNFVLGTGLTGFTATWDYSTTGVISLTLTTVPEPATTGLLVGGLSTLLCLRRRRATI